MKKLTLIAISNSHVHWFEIISVTISRMSPHNLVKPRVSRPLFKVPQDPRLSGSAMGLKSKRANASSLRKRPSWNLQVISTRWPLGTLSWRTLERFVINFKYAFKKRNYIQRSCKWQRRLSSLLMIVKKLFENCFWKANGKFSWG